MAPGALALALVAVLFRATACTINGFPNSLGVTPPRGARTWNSVRSAINQTFVEASVDGLVAPLPSGGSLATFGYTDMGIDDAWEECVDGTYHDKSGRPMVDLLTFPALQNVTTRAHAKGLTTSWYMNCCGCSEHGQPTTHYVEDALAVAAFGFDGVKIDGCGNEGNMTEWAVALNATGKALMLENCNDGSPFRPTRAPDGSVDCPYNLFRTSIDGAPNFRSTMLNAHLTVEYLEVSSPGCYAYADMLTIGSPAPGYGGASFQSNCNGTRLSVIEAMAQMATFSLLSSPLILGFDVANATERATWAPIVTHGPTLAINSAWDGEAGRLVASSSANWTGTVFVGGACELGQTNTMPLWMVVGKRLAHDVVTNATTKFAAVMIVGDYAGAVDFFAPLSAMGFSESVVSSVDGWTGENAGDVQGAWSGTGVVAPGGEYRVFSAK